MGLRKEANAALNSFTDSVIKALKKKDGKVTLTGFGTFSKGKRKARKGRNPNTKDDQYPLSFIGVGQNKYDVIISIAIDIYELIGIARCKWHFNIKKDLS